MHDNELWQIFAPNGQPLAGRGAARESFDNDHTLLMGNAHVWLWRQIDGGRQVLLQKGSMTRKLYPGMYHISVAGHINVGETPVDTAVREAAEEMAVSIDPSLLRFVCCTRGGSRLESLNTVFVYQLTSDVIFQFDDGEVESVKWVPVSEFALMTNTPEAYNLVPRSRTYFDDVIVAIEKR